MPLPRLHYSTNNLPADVAIESWRDLMAPMYHVESADRTGVAPLGTLTAYLLGDIIGNRTLFSPQHVTRNKRKISTTPDHLVLQLWRSGGYRGEVSGKKAVFNGGQVLLADRRREVDARFTKSDTIGFVIPRALLDVTKSNDLPLSFDTVRNRLAAASLTSLYRRLPSLEPADVKATEAELLGCLRRLLDPSEAADVLEGAELDLGLVELARRAVDVHFSTPSLSPETLANMLQVSRATLYRAFAPIGGIAVYIGEQRLLAARTALEDPLEMRTITQIATAYGFSSLAFFSRSFSGRFELSPRECRADAMRRASENASSATETIKRWFHKIGNDPAAR